MIEIGKTCFFAKEKSGKVWSTQSEWQYEKNSLCGSGIRYRNTECLSHMQSWRVTPISLSLNNTTYFNKRLFFLGDSICKELASAFSCEIDLSFTSTPSLRSRTDVDCSIFPFFNFSMCYKTLNTFDEKDVKIYKREFAIADYVVLHFGLHHKNEGDLKQDILRIVRMIDSRCFVVWLTHGAQHFNFVGGMYNSHKLHEKTKKPCYNISISEAERVDWRFQVDKVIPWKKYNISVIDWWELSVLSTDFHTRFLIKPWGLSHDCSHWCHSRSGIPYTWVKTLSAIIERNKRGFIFKVPIGRRIIGT